MPGIPTCRQIASSFPRSSLSTVAQQRWAGKAHRNKVHCTPPCDLPAIAKGEGMAGRVAMTRGKKIFFLLFVPSHHGPVPFFSGGRYSVLCLRGRWCSFWRDYLPVLLGWALFRFIRVSATVVVYPL